jgi:hypothetical protein
VTFVAKAPGLDQAWSTRSDVYVVLLNGTTRIRKLSTDNRGAYSKPVYSPNGEQLIWLQISHHGYESDCNQITLMMRHEHSNDNSSSYRLSVESKRQDNVEWDCSPVELV